MSIVAIAGSTFTYYLPGLEDQDNPGLFKTSPTIAAGDFTISTNGGGFEAMDNTPTVTPTGGKQVKFILSTDETTAAGDGGTIVIQCSDAAGTEWFDVAINVPVRAADLSVATPATVAAAILVTPANLLATDTSGRTSAILADGVTHGGTTAAISLKKIVVDNTDFGGTAIAISSNTTGGVGVNVEGAYRDIVGDIRGALSGAMTAQQTRDALLLAATPPGTGATDSIDDKLDTIAASPGGLTAQETANAVNNLAPASTGATGSVRAKLDALVAGQATGTYSYSNTVDDGSGNLLDGVFIQCATDSAFTNIVNTTHTNVLGAFTVYSDVAGTHYLRLQLSGYTFTDQTVTLA